MKDYLLKEEVYELVGCCIKVHQELGVGFSEIVYKDALQYELNEMGILFAREVEFKINYRDIVLPHYFYADFVIHDQIILEAKAVSELRNEHVEQTINYLASSRLEVGLLVNFRKPRIEYKRLILSAEKRETNYSLNNPMRVR